LPVSSVEREILSSDRQFHVRLVPFLAGLQSRDRESALSQLRSCYRQRADPPWIFRTPKPSGTGKNVRLPSCRLCESANVRISFGRFANCRHSENSGVARTGPVAMPLFAVHPKPRNNVGFPACNSGTAATARLGRKHLQDGNKLQSTGWSARRRFENRKHPETQNIILRHVSWFSADIEVTITDDPTPGQTLEYVRASCR